MLEIKKLCVNYGKLRIVHNVDMEINKGEIVALIGANGTGKTTLVRAISRLNPIASGNIMLHGHDITLYTADRIVEAGITQVPEGRKLFPQMSVRENIEMGAYAKRAKSRFSDNLEFIYTVFPVLKEMEKKACGNLSGGQQQMVAIARGIMSDPELLILDEPSVGLSPLITKMMFEAIEQIKNNGISILITEQNIQDVLKMADRAYVMQQGQIAMSGTATDVMKNEELRRIYLGM